MSRVVVQSYKPSNSAKALATYLGLKRLSTSASRFVGRPSDIIINWGNVNRTHSSQYLNPLDAVATAANKISTFAALSAASIPVPEVHHSSITLDPDTTYFARTNICGHSGDGIVVGLPSELPSARLYTKYINKKHEYRVIVVDSIAVDTKKKLRKRDFEGERSPYIWNVANGYVFARNDIIFPSSLQPLAIDAINALGLSYGAVDIIEDSRGNLFVLEVNTAFGLEGTTTQLVGDAIQELINQRRQ